MTKGFILTWFGGFLDQDVEKDAIVWTSATNLHGRSPFLYVDLGADATIPTRLEFKKTIPRPMPLPHFRCIEDANSRSTRFCVDVSEMWFKSGMFLSSQPNGSVEYDRTHADNWENYVIIPDWLYKIMMSHKFINIGQNDRVAKECGRYAEFIGQHLITIGDEIYHVRSIINGFLAARGSAIELAPEDVTVELTDLNGTVNHLRYI